jgi:hypothetical protein
MLDLAIQNTGSFNFEWCLELTRSNVCGDFDVVTVSSWRTVSLFVSGNQVQYEGAPSAGTTGRWRACEADKK